MTKIGCKFPSLVFEIWCSQGLRDAQTHSVRHSLTDGQTRIQYASAPFFNGGGGTKIHNVILPDLNITTSVQLFLLFLKHIHLNVNIKVNKHILFN